MKLINQTGISDRMIRAVIRFTRPPGIKKFKVVVRKTRRAAYHGRGGSNGIKVYINAASRYPRRLYTYQYGQLKGRRYYLASLTEALIYIFAHELMHTKQGQSGCIRGKVWGARGRYSEIQTESYAIRKLREYRRLT